ncbi:hypothetical protein ACFWF7_41475 [Nocardia sp. NPDC060256]|uniref:hypothetical protein n=1 Tax=unclassified Nocardia TaxID=2637762 RepID=UPI00365EC8A1
MTTIPTRDDADYAEQLTTAYDLDHDAGLDTTALTPPPENIRTAIDPADTIDRIEQSLITPAPDDDYPFA